MKGRTVRRTSKILVSAVGTLLVAPLAVAAQAVPANAATGKLLVTTLGRTGVARASQIVALNVVQNNEFVGNSGRAFSVPDGRYAVIAGATTSAQKAASPNTPAQAPTRYVTD